ncbi:substrate-binding periplasmic protein [Bowmanella dokdonensis]|uniref:ABC transporter substrate-binding protein n=1 Tax=Bowmanella dokdonensis TaxID=751969 RepID=A0A939DMW1_9ALTE|nr:transporter substrate-binding domain-containing protein [Bowmanella dokdonensis]MBN7825577.1 ABC transporter substrate-binding protein [Bowmanella dokdonensis]
MNRHTIIFCCLILGLQTGVAHTEPDKSPSLVIYPGYARDDYMVSVLKLALSHLPENAYEVRALGADLPKERAFDLLGAPDGLDVLTGTCLKDRSHQALPVHFPLLRGLNGMRIGLIPAANPDKLKAVKNLTDLKALHIGQYHSWSDTRILRANGLRVFAGGDYEGLYLMLDRQRIDVFPRSVLEIEQNLAQHPTLELMIDSHLLIQYPSAYYFFVSRDNPQLAIDLKQGLESALQDGSFDKLFEAQFGEILQRLGIKQRHLLHLDNPFLCDGVPINRQTLWVNPPAS